MAQMPGSAPTEREAPGPDAATFLARTEERIRALDLRLTDIVSRGERTVAALGRLQAGIQDAIRSDRHDLLEDSRRRAGELEDELRRELEALRRDGREAIAAFRGEAGAVLEAYRAAASRAREAVVATDARLDALTVGLTRLVSTAAAEIRGASGALRPGASARPYPRALLPLMGALVLAGTAGGAYLAGQLGDVRERAAAAERVAQDARAAAARAREAPREGALADAVGSADRAERMMQVMVAPDARRMPLAGGAAAPAASGQALWSRTRGAVLTATGLPRTAAGDVYQVWLSTTRGVLALGFASPDAQGRMTATFEIPSELPGNVTGFLLTREPAGGSPAPQGPVALSTL